MLLLMGAEYTYLRGFVLARFEVSEGKRMRVAIAGTRTIPIDPIALEDLLRSSGFHKKVETFAHGGSGLVDYAAERMASRMKIPARVFHPDWGRYGKPAGPMRNEEMSHWCDALLAVWDGESPGTYDTIRRFKKKEKPFRVYLWPKKRFLQSDEDLDSVAQTQSDEPTSTSNCAS